MNIYMIDIFYFHAFENYFLTFIILILNITNKKSKYYFTILTKYKIKTLFI